MSQASLQTHRVYRPNKRPFSSHALHPPPLFFSHLSGGSVANQLALKLPTASLQHHRLTDQVHHCVVYVIVPCNYLYKRNLLKLRQMLNMVMQMLTT